MGIPKHIVLAVLLVVVGLCVYLPQLNNIFLYDDYKNMRVVSAQEGQSFIEYFKINEYQHYIPYNQILNRLMYGYLPWEPGSFRLVNLALFLTSVLLMFFLCRLLGVKEEISFWATLFFVVHPLNAMMLNHIFVSFVLLFAVFFLASFICYVNYDKTSRPLFLGLSIFFFVNAQLCLEFYVALPFVLFFYLVMVRRAPLARALRRLSVFIVLTLLHVVFWVKFVAHGSSFFVRISDLGLNIFSFLSSYSYLVHWFTAKVFFPDGIVYIYNIWPLKSGLGAMFFFGLLIAEALVLLAWVVLPSRRSQRGFYLLFFAAGFIPSAISCLGHSYMGMVFEPYWMFVATIGLFVLLADVLNSEGLSKMLSPWVRRALSAAVGAYWFIFSFYYIRVGKTELDYYVHWNKSSPGNYVALTNLAQHYFKNRDYDNALRYYQQAVGSIGDERLYPPTIAYYDIAQIYVELGRLDEARAILDKLINIEPANQYAYFTLGRLERARGDVFGAEKNFLKAAFLNEPLMPALFALTELYIDSGRIDQVYALLDGLLQKGKTDRCYELLQHLNDQRQYAVGLEVLERRADALKGHGDYFLLKGIFLVNQMDYARALEVWNEGLKANPQDSRLREYMDQAKRILASKPVADNAH